MSTNLNMCDTPALIFVHIPKTAGTTFNYILDTVYKKKCIHNIDSLKFEKAIDKFNKMEQINIDSIDLLKGHFTFYLGKLFEREAQFITFLRKPKDLFISSFFYIRGAKHNKAHNEVKKLKSIEEYARWRLKTNTDNIQFRYLVNAVPYYNLEKRETDLEKVGEQYIIESKQLLNNEYDFVLLTEYFDESLFLLKHHLKWHKLPFYQKMNVSVKNDSFFNKSSEENDLVDRACYYDQIVYDEGKKIFLEKWNKIKGRLHYQLLLYQKINLILNPLFKLRSKLS